MADFGSRADAVQAVGQGGKKAFAVALRPGFSLLGGTAEVCPRA